MHIAIKSKKNKKSIFMLYICFCVSLILFLMQFVFADNIDFQDPTTDGFDIEANDATEFEIRDIKTNELKVVNYKGPETGENKNIIIKVPEKIEDKTVTEIDANCFSYTLSSKKKYPKRQYVGGIILPETIKKIGPQAFYNLPSLQWIIINSTDLESNSIDKDFLDNNSGDWLKNESCKLKAIYFPNLSKSTDKDILSPETLKCLAEQKIDVFYNEDCYEFKVSQGDKGEFDAENNILKLEDNQAIINIENTGKFDLPFEFNIDDNFTVSYDHDNKNWKLTISGTGSGILKIKSKYLTDKEIQLISEGETQPAKITWPTVISNLTYNGKEIQLMDIDAALNNLPGDYRMQFSFDGQNDWKDLSQASCPKQKNAGKYKIYLRVVKNGELVEEYESPDGKKYLEAEIQKKKLTITGKIRAIDREYNGTQTVKLDTDDLNLEGKNDDDKVGLVVEDLYGIFTDGNKNAGNDKSVTIQGKLSLNGVDSKNYSLNAQFDKLTTVNIFARKIKIDGKGEIKAVDRDYNGKIEVELDKSDLDKNLKIVHDGNEDSEVGIISGEDVFLDYSQLKGEMEDKNAGEEKNVKIDGNIVLGGKNKNNYELNLSGEEFNRTTKVNIAKRKLKLVGKIKAENKTYDQTTNVKLDCSSLKLDGKIKDDIIEIDCDKIVGQTENKNAGENKKVIIRIKDGEEKGILTGIDAENYYLNEIKFNDVMVDILRKEIGLVGNLEVVNKIYDGNENIEIKQGDLRLDGNDIISGDKLELRFDNLSGKAEDKNAGEKNVSLSEKSVIILEGTDKDNYVLKNEDLERIFYGNKVLIKKLPAEFIWDKDEFYYDGLKHGVTARVRNIKSSSDIFDLRYNNNQGIEYGTYHAKVVALGNNNYTLENAKNAEKIWFIGEKPNNAGAGGSGGGSVNFSVDNNIKPVNDFSINMVNLSKKCLKDISVPDFVKKRKYINGYEDKSFRMNNKIKRAEVAQGIYKLINNGEEVNLDILNRFSDIDKNAWYKKSVGYLLEKKIMSGYENKFRPNDFVTRGEVAQILFNALKMLDNDLDKSYIYGKENYRFVDLDEKYFGTEAIKQLASNGMINGYGNGIFKAQEKINRAEFVAMVAKVFGRDLSLLSENKYIDLSKDFWAYSFILNASE